MAVDTVTTSSSVDVNGNSYTTAVSNDELTNDDFLTLMIEELKMQDPTDPMDSSAMMDSQLQMSTIESNLSMAESMDALRSSYANSALSTAANLIGKTVGNGELGSDGYNKSFKIESISSEDGELNVVARQMTGLSDVLQNTETEDFLEYGSSGGIYEDGELTDYMISMDANGNFILDEDGEVQILDEDGELVTDEDVTSKYTYYGSTITYAESAEVLPLSSIIEVR
ncbi:MAG: flagellar hook capping FlgD N-terminal domain-containing protein [Campylobacterota bacterium]|nr:flagellar hook capping FlgD N-terminal domain-containing protein [Campylobacterota bacterium]